MISEKRTVGIGVIFVSLTVATVWAAIRTQDPKTQSKEQWTVVTGESLTEAQKKHGKPFSDAIRKKLRSLPGGTTIYIPAEGSDLPTYTQLYDVQAKRDFFQAMVCGSDLIVVGKPTQHATQITEFGDFIFTDYEINIEDLIRDKSSALQTGSTVTITRPGGAVILNGNRYRVIDRSFNSLDEGKRYLLFLKFDADSSTYLPDSKHGSFLIEGGLRSLSDATVPYWLEGTENTNSFISNLRSVSGGCSQGGVK